MNVRLHLLLSVIVMILAGCADIGSQSSALRIGMSRDQVVATLGAPNSVSAQGVYEYLNYALSETTPHGSSLVRPYYVRLIEGKVEAFGYSDQINRIAPSLTAASARSRSDRLRIGMTKDEAVTTMGQPASVSAQGTSEYLNYTVTDVNAAIMRSITRPYYVRLVGGKVEAFGYPEQIGRAAPVISSMSATADKAVVVTDSVDVISITPKILTPGKRQSVSVRVRYSMPTREKAVIAILFNTSEPTRFRPVPGGEEVVSKGSGEIVINGTITPVDWGVAGQFAVKLHLLESPRLAGQFAAPLLSTQFAIPLAGTEPPAAKQVTATSSATN